MDNSQVDTNSVVPQGPAKWIGYAVGIALLLMAVTVAVAMFISQSGGDTAPDTTAPMQSNPPQPTTPNQQFSAPQQ